MNLLEQCRRRHRTTQEILHQGASVTLRAVAQQLFGEPAIPAGISRIESTQGFGDVLPLANYQPEEFVRQTQPWARMMPLEHDELLTKCQILKKETVTRPKETNHRSEAEFNEMKHG